MEEDRETISTCMFLFLSFLAHTLLVFGYVSLIDNTCAVGIKRTKLRLIRCRARKNMNNRDRLKDARADKNLDDVPRIPAPWDTEALLEFQKKTAAGEGSPKQS